MNRRHVIASLGFMAVAAAQRASAADNELPGLPVTRTLVAPGAEDVQLVEALAVTFVTARTAANTVAVLRQRRLDFGGAEIYLVDLEELDPPKTLGAGETWIAIYTTVAGAAAVETRHRHAIWSVNASLFELVVAGNDHAAITDLFGALFGAMNERVASGSPLTEILPSLDDVPEGFEVIETDVEATPMVSDGEA